MSSEPPPSTQKRLPPDERRRQLIGCAIAACAERGIGRTTHAAVSRKAKVSVPTVFHYFPSRDALLGQVLDEVQKFFLEIARSAHGVSGRADERLTEHGRRFLAAAAERPDYLRVWLDWSTAIREETWPGYLAFQERLVDIVADSIARDPELAHGRGFDARDAARIFVGNAHMAAMMYFAPDSGIDLDDHIRRTVTLLLGSGLAE